MTTKGSVMTTEVARIAQPRNLLLANEQVRNSLPGKQLQEYLRRKLRAKKTLNLRARGRWEPSDPVCDPQEMWARTAWAGRLPNFPAGAVRIRALAHAGVPVAILFNRPNSLP
jgi:hypothetical protein